VRSNRTRGLLLAFASSLALTLVVPTGAAAQEESLPGRELTAEVRKKLVQQIRKHRKATWHWQRVMGKRRTPTEHAERRATSIATLKRLRDGWRGRARKTVRKARRVPYRGAWLCIKRYEGAWTDPNAPYWGGLQMDLSFQRSYGRYLLRKKGTANRWRPLEQMWTAEKARRSGRGFYPWPNTARRCGLI
jgi:hypothetical protein